MRIKSAVSPGDSGSRESNGSNVRASEIRQYSISQPMRRLMSVLLAVQFGVRDVGMI